jgi:hypothetical protein
MGHLYLCSLPDTAPWRRVVTLIAGEADAATVATATTEAALRGLDAARDDAGLLASFWNLTQLVLAARQPDFVGALRGAGFTIPEQPGIFDLAASLSARLDAECRKGKKRTDLGEMAQMAAVESVVPLLREGANNLFEISPQDVHRAAADLAKERGFGHLAHTFFSRFTQRFLTYHLGRELSNHVGGNGRFGSSLEHNEFVRELGVHSEEVAAIMRGYAGDWFSKHTAPAGGGITPTKVRRFVNHTLRKIEGELLVRGGRDDD